MKKVLILAAAAFLSGVMEARADKFADCMVEAGKVSEEAGVKCMNDKTKELMQEIKFAYENALKEDAFVKWNSGNGMKQGNFRSVFDNWLAYRDRYCAVYALSMENYVGSYDYNQADCVLDFTRDHLDRIKRLKENILSTIY